jgi:hypothetical protein
MMVLTVEVELVELVELVETEAMVETQILLEIIIVMEVAHKAAVMLTGVMIQILLVLNK